MYMYFEKVNIVFLYYVLFQKMFMQHLDHSGTSKHTCMHIHVQYLHVHISVVPDPVAQSVE